MRSMSLKALTIANIVDIVLIFALNLVFLLGAYFFAAQSGIGPEIARQRLAGSGIFITVVSALSFSLAAAAAGYAAARIAKRAYLLHGALSSVGIVSFNIINALYGPLLGPSRGVEFHIPSVLNHVIVNSGPLYGALGGYIASLRGSPIDATVGSGAARNIVGSIGRWLLAFVAATVGYYVALLFLSTFLKQPPWSAIFAVVAATALGTAVAPTQDRKVAGLVFVGLAVLTPVAKLGIDKIIGVPTATDELLVVVNAMGAFFAYRGFRRLFPDHFNPGQAVPTA